jgi:organic radical activating enzyme
MAEVEKHGSYKLSGDSSLHDPNFIRQIGKYPIRHDEPNPYIDAFWAWWPDLYKDLEVFRITGGEPLLSKHTWTVLDYAKNNPNSKLEIAVNTNLGVPDKLIDQLIDNIKEVRQNVKEVKIYTSIEAAGPAAEYIRFGMDYAKFIANINRLLLEIPGQRVVIMTTINALSAFSFVEFLAKMVEIRTTFKDTKSTLGLSFNYLRWPVFQDIRILPDNIKEEIGNDIRQFMKDNKQFFIGEELDQVERLIKYMKQDIPNRDSLLEDFKCFYNQYDHRKGLSFAQTFPQIARLVK